MALPVPQPTTTPAQPVASADQLRREFVAGGQQWNVFAARTLPQYLDEATLQWGDDLYERMALDPAVSSAFGVLKTSILAGGGRVVPHECHEDAPERDREVAAEMARFVQCQLDALDPGFLAVLDNMLDAIALGNKVAEKVWATKVWEGRSMLMLTALKPKPRRNVAFVVDAYMNLIGFLARVPNQPYPVRTGSVIQLDPGTLPPNFVPRDKMAVLTHGMKDCDPRGTSTFRAAVDWWWTKISTIPEMRKYAAQFATPSLWGTTPPAPEGGQRINPTLATGDPTPEQLMLQAMLDFQNGSAMAFQHGAVVNLIQALGGEKVFQVLFSICDAQITVAILLQLLASSTTDHQTQASTKEHGNILDDLIAALKAVAILGMINKDLIKPMIEYNYPESDWHLCPSYSLGAIEAQDLTPLMTAIARLAQVKYLDESQYDGLDVKMELPPRDPDWREQKEARAAAVAAATTPAQQDDAEDEAQDDDAMMDGDDPDQDKDDQDE